MLSRLGEDPPNTCNIQPLIWHSHFSRAANSELLQSCKYQSFREYMKTTMVKEQEEKEKRGAFCMLWNTILFCEQVDGLRQHKLLPLRLQISTDILHSWLYVVPWQQQNPERQIWATSPPIHQKWRCVNRLQEAGLHLQACPPCHHRLLIDNSWIFTCRSFEA